MGFSVIKKPFLLVLILGLLIFSKVQLDRNYQLPFPHFQELVTTTEHALEDALFISFGFRALAADVAWIQLLQNMGDLGSTEQNNKPYPFLKDETLRVVRIDPYFRTVYLFGAATLAWIQNINRPDEAMEILAEGIRYNPTYWPLRVYAAGIGYMRSNERGSMIRMLEEAIRVPECPVLVKSILANSYKLEKRYKEALIIWESVLASSEAREYHTRAREEIPILRSKIQSDRAPIPPTRE